MTLYMEDLEIGDAECIFNCCHEEPEDEDIPDVCPRDGVCVRCSQTSKIGVKVIQRTGGLMWWVDVCPHFAIEDDSTVFARSKIYNDVVTEEVIE